ncbi:MAG: nucleotidyltransferase family protein [Bacteroidia bacterium]|nr:nucleotidyltransferase family protein [Bacteroidia bacterium]
MTARVSAAFFALLRSGLGLESLDTEGWWPLSAGEWQELYVQSNRHTVLGIVFDGLQELPSGEGRIPMPLFAKWAVEVEGTEKAWKLQHAIVEAQKAAWEKRGIKGVVLKGQTVAAMYPHPERRTSGDIDWWFGDENDWRKANEIAAANAGSLTEDSDGDVHYTFKGVVVEHHRKWNDASSRKARKALAGLKPDIPEATLAMLELHILKHAMVMGIGMRQVCDLVMARRWFEGKYDTSAFEELMGCCGLAKWNALLDGLIEKCFGPGKCYDESTADADDVGRLLELILADGNFGLEHGRGAGCVIGSVWGRAGFFMKYAPREFLWRLGRLTIGRLKRKK